MPATYTPTMTSNSINATLALPTAFHAGTLTPALMPGRLRVCGRTPPCAPKRCTPTLGQPA